MKMPSVASLAAALISLVEVASALDPAQDYWFRVNGGNSALDGQFLRLGGTPYPGVTIGFTPSTDYFLRMRPTTNGQFTSLSIVPVGPNPPPLKGYYALKGPGRDDFQLTQNYMPTAPVTGYQIKYTEWTTATTSTGKTLLRYNDEAAQSHWVAVPNYVYLGETSPATRANATRWVVWWAAPNAQNIQDLSDYILIDIEAVPATPGINN